MGWVKEECHQKKDKSCRKVRIKSDEISDMEHKVGQSATRKVFR